EPQADQPDQADPADQPDLARPEEQPDPADQAATAPADDPVAVSDAAAGDEIFVPDLSDDDFFAASSAHDSEPAADHEGDSATAVAAEDRPSNPAPAPDAEHREPTAADDDAAEPMEYAQPRWEEPTWHDAPAGGVAEGAEPDGSDSTSAGSGAVDVGAVVVPPPDDDDLDFLDDYAGADSSSFAAPNEAGPNEAGPSQTAPPPQSHGNGGAKPFKSRFAALAEKHGASSAQSTPSGYGSQRPASPDESYGGSGAFGGNGSAQGQGADTSEQHSGSVEDEYDPETDLDVSEAPQIGVDVIARVLGGEVIDEREV
ncbi:MAG: DNA polymerase III subunit gamma and tau, partial [Brevibacterium sp.]